MSSDSGSASDSDDKGDMMRIPRREVTDNDKELMKAAVAGFYDPPHPILKAIQGAAEMQRKIDNLATRLTVFTNELSNLNPFLIAEETVKEARALHPNDKAGKKVVQDALRAARQG
ncbi:hypothetical protein AnigIFM60653_000336 [Aspergillus niger]|nr:hypothetical protein AnigIFM60653_000336 [Aspergillus niger]